MSRVMIVFVMITAVWLSTVPARAVGVKSFSLQASVSALAITVSDPSPAEYNREQAEYNVEQTEMQRELAEVDQEQAEEMREGNFTAEEAEERQEARDEINKEWQKNVDERMSEHAFPYMPPPACGCPVPAPCPPPPPPAT